ncbi:MULTISPECIES: OmpA family protein [unclassified Roseitalea]|uniref:OmpA family protein n=1 Tax=unclassified Roseitalea TaxID=2639107 RepID=UPI00273EFC13|nr:MULTISPECIES: OmpA family protein [unclassified Roseitalea]
MTSTINRRAALGVFAGSLAAATPALAQSTPSAATIMRQLGADPRFAIEPEARVSVDELKQRHDLRRIAPSIDIRSINFAFGSARIPRSELHKVEQIAIALRRMARRRPREIFLVEGHTDAVGSAASNLRLSDARARSVARELVAFGVPRRAMETIGYGERYLLVPTQAPEWRNRRVTLRRITDFIG